MPTNTKGIVDYKLNEGFTGFLLVKNFTKGNARNGNAFLSVNLGDSSGEIRTMVWNADEEKEAEFAPGKVLWFTGDITEFQSNKQLNVHDYRQTDENDNVKVTDFLQRAPIEGHVLLSRIVAEVNNLSNLNIKAITLSILNKYASDFKTYPAAKGIHHAYVSGLAFHTYSMLNIGKSMCELYPILNKDLLLAGIVLHDIGKISDYTGYLNTEMTLAGKLKGHISIISEEIGQTAKELDISGSEEELLLQHMVLSHHGLASHGWGSAVSPQIIEANILHTIDKMDAEMDTYTSAIQKTDSGEFTERIFGLDNRAFYNHDLS